MPDHHLSPLKLDSFPELSFYSWEGELFSSSEGSGPWPLICQIPLPLEASLLADQLLCFSTLDSIPLSFCLLRWCSAPPLHLLEMK